MCNNQDSLSGLRIHIKNLFLVNFVTSLAKIPMIIDEIITIALATETPGATIDVENHDDNEHVVISSE